MDESLLLQFAQEIEHYAKSFTELRLLLHGAVVQSPENRIEISKKTLDSIMAGDYKFSTFNKADSVVLIADKNIKIEVAHK